MQWITDLVAPPIGPSLLFLLANVVALLLILRSNRRQKTPISDELTPAVAGVPPQDKLSASDVLGWEFGYARASASESMTERHSVVNIYLLATGVLLSGVAAVLGGDTDLPAAAGTLLLWLLCLIGWVYFLAIVRLRQAWSDSAKTMNQIKDFYIRHASDFSPDAMHTAFRWQTGTLPRPDKPWTIYFYSAMLIAVVNSGAYVVGGLLLSPGAPKRFDPLSVGLISAFGLVFLSVHARLYFAFLKR